MRPPRPAQLSAPRAATPHNRPTPPRQTSPPPRTQRRRPRHRCPPPRQDVIYLRHNDAPAPGDCHSMFMVCDGHQGVGAARHVAEMLPALLGRTLPQELPDWDAPGGGGGRPLGG